MDSDPESNLNDKTLYKQTIIERYSNKPYLYQQFNLKRIKIRKKTKLTEVYHSDDEYSSGIYLKRKLNHLKNQSRILHSRSVENNLKIKDLNPSKIVDKHNSQESQKNAKANESLSIDKEEENLINDLINDDNELVEIDNEIVVNDADDEVDLELDNNDYNDQYRFDSTDNHDNFESDKPLKSNLPTKYKLPANNFSFQELSKEQKQSQIDKLEKDRKLNLLLQKKLSNSIRDDELNELKIRLREQFKGNKMNVERKSVQDNELFYRNNNEVNVNQLSYVEMGKDEYLIENQIEGKPNQSSWSGFREQEESSNCIKYAKNRKHRTNKSKDKDSTQSGHKYNEKSYEHRNDGYQVFEKIPIENFYQDYSHKKSKNNNIIELNKDELIILESSRNLCSPIYHHRPSSAATCSKQNSCQNNYMNNQNFFYEAPLHNNHRNRLNCCTNVANFTSDHQILNGCNLNRTQFNGQVYPTELMTAKQQKTPFNPNDYSNVLTYEQQSRKLRKQNDKQTIYQRAAMFDKSKTVNHVCDHRHRTAHHMKMPINKNQLQVYDNRLSVNRHSPQRNSPRDNNLDNYTYLDCREPTIQSPDCSSYCSSYTAEVIQNNNFNDNLSDHLSDNTISNSFNYNNFKNCTNHNDDQIKFRNQFSDNHQRSNYIDYNQSNFDRSYYRDNCSSHYSNSRKSPLYSFVCSFYMHLNSFILIILKNLSAKKFYDPNALKSPGFNF